MTARIALAFAIGALTANAEVTTSIRSLSLSDCIQIALEHNLDVKIARYGPKIERYRLDFAYAAYEPVFEASGTREHMVLPDRSSGDTHDLNSYQAGIAGILPTGMRLNLAGELAGASEDNSSGSFESASGSTRFELRQPLLRDSWIDGARLNILVSKKRLRISELSLRQEIMEVVTAVQLNYYDLQLARERVKAQEQALQRAARLVFESQKRVAVGALARLDEKQAESQLSARQVELLGAQGALLAQEYALKRLLGGDFAEWENVKILPVEALSPAPAVLNLHQSWRNGLTYRPDFLQLKLEIERQGFVLKYLRNQLFPQLDVVGSYGQSGFGPDYHGALESVRRREGASYSLGIVMSIPLGGNQEARATYRSSQAEREQSLLALKKLEQDIMVELGVLIADAQTRLDQIAATKQSCLFAEAALEAEQKKLDIGRSTGFVMLQLQRELTQARLAELGALTEYNKALARLALREGTTLERNKLEVRGQ